MKSHLGLVEGRGKGWRSKDLQQRVCALWDPENGDVLWAESILGIIRGWFDG